MVETFAEYPPLGQFAVRDMCQTVVVTAISPGVNYLKVGDMVYHGQLFLHQPSLTHFEPHQKDPF